MPTKARNRLSRSHSASWSQIRARVRYSQKVIGRQKRMRNAKLSAALIVALLSAASALHAAQAAFPEKPIRLVIGSAPGSGPDIISRALADRLYAAWGQR